MRLKSPTNTPVHVALLTGDAILIGPDGRDVPVRFRQQAFVNGAIPDGVSVEEMTEETPKPTEKGRFEKLQEVLIEMRAGGVPLTGSGMPNRKDVAKVAGWNVSAEEFARAWNTLPQL